MKNSFIFALCVVLAGNGCQVFKPLHNPDSLDNATSQTWSLVAEFDSRPQYGYTLEANSFSDFGTMSRGAIPTLTSVVAVSKEGSTRYSLSSREIASLRRAAPGGLTLVIYDDGIACLSPAIKKDLANDMRKVDYTRQEYFRLLKAQAKPALLWTRQTLATR